MLKFEIHAGKSFLDFVLDSDEQVTGENPSFVIHISYKAQRFYSKAVPCQCEPSFNEVFMIDIGYFESNSPKMQGAIREGIFP